jgi:hypothetical protein
MWFFVFLFALCGAVPLADTGIKAWERTQKLQVAKEIVIACQGTLQFDAEGQAVAVCPRWKEPK